MQHQDNLSANFQNITAPLESKLLALYAEPYNKYNYLNEAWHQPSHGININNKEDLAIFFHDMDKSEAIWKESGVHLGFILQALEKNIVIDRGFPLGLAPELENDEEEAEKYIHINSKNIPSFIDLYQEYLVSEGIQQFDNLHIEIKPFYAMNNYEINYEEVEQNWNKRLEIK